jgi:hypothetical protein
MNGARINIWLVVLADPVVIVLATGPKIRGFQPVGS